MCETIKTYLLYSCIHLVSSCVEQSSVRQTSCTRKEGAGSLQTGVEGHTRDPCHTPVSCVTHLLLVVTGVCHTSGFCVTHFNIVCHTSVFLVTHLLLECVTLLCHLYHTSLVFRTSVLCVTCFNIVYHAFFVLWYTLSSQILKL